MKKLVIIVMLVGVSLFLAACSGGSAGGEDVSKLNDLVEDVKDARDEAIYRQEFTSVLSREPLALATFLFEVGELGKIIGEEDTENFKIIEDAVALFIENEEVHQQALERAKEVYAGVHIDCNWVELRKIAPRSDDFETYEEYKAYKEQNLPAVPLATSAETGEPIANNHDNPAGPWGVAWIKTAIELKTAAILPRFSLPL